MAGLLARLKSRVQGPNQRRLVERVLEGDARATEELVTALLPIIQRRVAWVLSRRGRARREDALDYAQEALMRLLENDARVLRTWEPDRGASLETFAGLVAERHVLSALRSGRKSAWREDPLLDAKAETLANESDLEQLVWSRDLLERLLDRLEEELTPRSRQLFTALFVEELTIEEAAARFNMSSNALYSWQSRFRTRAVELAKELEAPSDKVAQSS
jgi:RNA polymerase sigma-70 factor (ECF subfamily)